MNTIKKAPGQATEGNADSKDTQKNGPPVVVMGKWRIMHNPQTKENRMIPTISEIFSFPGSPWTEVFSGSFLETLAEKKIMDQNGPDGR